MPSTDDPATHEPPTGDRFPYELVSIVLLAVLVLVYGVFVAQAVLAAVGIAIPLVALYLFWRFVRAHERIADAME